MIFTLNYIFVSANLPLFEKKLVFHFKNKFIDNIYFKKLKIKTKGIIIKNITSIIIQYIVWILIYLKVYKFLKTKKIIAKQNSKIVMGTKWISDRPKQNKF